MSRIQKCNVRPYQLLMVSVYNYLTSLILTSNELLSEHFLVLKAFALQRMQKKMPIPANSLLILSSFVYDVFFFFCKFQRTLKLLCQSIVSFLKKTSWFFSHNMLSMINCKEYHTTHPHQILYVFTPCQIFLACINFKFFFLF